MNPPVAGSAQSTISTERTKKCIRITAWATRILALISIVFCIVAFVTLVDINFGIFLIITLGFSIMSPLNFNCCCYSDCSRNTKTEKALGHCGVYLWMFLSNMGHVIVFGYSWFYWVDSRDNYYRNYRYNDYDVYDEGRNDYQSQHGYPPDYGYYYKTHDVAMLDTVFAFTLIITFFLSILNLYSFCLVYKYGCCFMNEIDRDHLQQNVETAVVMNQQVSMIGGGMPVNDSQFPNATLGVQQAISNDGAQFPQYQPYLVGPYYMAAPHQQALGTTTDSIGVLFPLTTPTTIGQPVSPPPYAEADPVVKQSQ